MSYYIIADLDVKKYTIYQIRGNENFYHNFVKFLKSRTGHNIVGVIQNDPLINESILNVNENDFIYFERYLQKFNTIA